MKSPLVVFLLALTAANHVRGQDDARGPDDYWRIRIPCVNSVWGDVQWVPWRDMHSVRVTTEVSPLRGQEYPNLAPSYDPPLFGMQEIIPWAAFDSNPGHSYMVGDLFVHALVSGLFNAPSIERPFVARERLSDALWNESCQSEYATRCFDSLRKQKCVEVPVDVAGVAGLRVGMKLNDALNILRRNSAIELPIAKQDGGFAIRHNVFVRGRVISLTGTRGGRVERIRIVKTNVIGESAAGGVRK